MRFSQSIAVSYIALLAGSLTLTGCASLPELTQATGGIPLEELVLRIKCEMSQAFEVPDPDKGGEIRWVGEQDKFQWMKDWTSQIDLSLEIVDAASVSPGISVTEPRPNAYSTSGPSNIAANGTPGMMYSAISQSLVLAGGVGFRGQASRTQTFSFNYSLAELHRWRQLAATKEQCSLSDGMGLQGRLGLREWVVMSLAPVRNNLLYAGYHPKVEGVSADKTKANAAGSDAKVNKTGNAPAFDAAVKAYICDGTVAMDTRASAKTAIAAAGATIRAALGAPDYQALPDALKPLAAVVDKDQKDNRKSVAGVTSNIKKFETPYAAESPVLDPYYGKQYDKNIETAETSTKNLKASSNQNLDAEETNLTNLTTLETLVDQAQSALDAAAAKPGDCGLATAALKAAKTAEFAAKDAVTFVGNIQTDHKNILLIDANLKSFDAPLAAMTADLKKVDPPFTTLGESVSFVLGYTGNATPTWTFVKFKGPTGTLFSASATRTHTLSITIGSPAQGSPQNSAIVDNQKFLQWNASLKTLQ